MTHLMNTDITKRPHFRTEQVTDTTQVGVGDFLVHRLGSDTRVWEVTKRTRKTATLRTVKRTDRWYVDARCDYQSLPDGGIGLAVQYVEVLPDPDGWEVIVRETKDGTFRCAGNTLSKVVGTPMERVDYRC